jgi:hypothetical protein
MERDKLKKCKFLAYEMIKYDDTKIRGVNMCIQLEQATQLKRIADALEAANKEVDRKAMSRGRCGPM